MHALLIRPFFPPSFCALKSLPFLVKTSTCFVFETSILDLDSIFLIAKFAELSTNKCMHLIMREFAFTFCFFMSVFDFKTKW